MRATEETRTAFRRGVSNIFTSLASPPCAMRGRPSLFLSGLLAALALLGCQTEATAPADRHVSQSDLDFVTGLTNLAAFDREVIGNELARAADPRVRALALELEARIEAFEARVSAVAAEDGISPPPQTLMTTRSDMQSRVATLMATSRYDFDKEFLSDELVGNQQVLALAEQTQAEPTGDPELHKLLIAAGGRLRENVARIEAVQAQLHD